MEETGLEFEIATRARLKAAVAIQEAVGARLDWGLRPGPTLPAITLTRVPGPIAVHFKGDQGLQETRVQVDVWAGDITTALRLAHRVKKVLTPGAVIAAIPPNMVRGVRFERGFADQPDPATERTDAGAIVHRARFDIMIWWALTEEDQ